MCGLVSHTNLVLPSAISHRHSSFDCTPPHFIFKFIQLIFLLLLLSLRLTNSSSSSIGFDCRSLHRADGFLLHASTSFAKQEGTPWIEHSVSTNATPDRRTITERTASTLFEKVAIADGNKTIARHHVDHIRLANDFIANIGRLIVAAAWQNANNSHCTVKIHRRKWDPNQNDCEHDGAHEWPRLCGESSCGYRFERWSRIRQAGLIGIQIALSRRSECIGCVGGAVPWFAEQNQQRWNANRNEWKNANGHRSLRQIATFTRQTTQSQNKVSSNRWEFHLQSIKFNAQANRFGINFFEWFLSLQSGSQHTKSRLRWRFYILRLIIERIVGYILALRGAELRPLFPRWCHWRSGVPIEQHRFKSNRKSTGCSQQRNSAQKFEGSVVKVGMNRTWTINLYLISDTSSRTRWIASITVLATRCCSSDCRSVESTQFTTNGCNWFGWSICQNLFALQRPTDRKKENARKETNTEPSFQRIIRVRYPNHRGNLHRTLHYLNDKNGNRELLLFVGRWCLLGWHFIGINATWLGPCDQKWGNCRNFTPKKNWRPKKSLVSIEFEIGDRSIRNGRTKMRRNSIESLEWGLQFTTSTNCRMAQTGRVNWM